MIAKDTPSAPRSVLVTGCSSGIGRCLADGLRARGWRVLATARQAADVAQLVQDGFEALALDLDSSDSVRTCAAEALARTGGRLDALVNNAGYGQPGATEDLTRAALRAQFETNVFGTQELTNLILPAMRAAGRGRIVHISSLLGLVSLPYRGAYSASKFALEALANTLRLELRGSGIHVVLIEPGPIATRFRASSHAAFRARIGGIASAHGDNYRRVEARLAQSEPLAYATAPQAVLKPVVRALEARRPHARYTVTWPATAFALLRRLLPDRVLDPLLVLVGGGGRR